MRIRATRSGSPRPSWRARRRAEKIKLAKQQELARLEIQRKQLEVTKELDGYAEEKLDRAEAKKASNASAARAAVAARWSAFRARVANDRPLLMALLMVAICMVVAFVGQVLFYKNLHFPVPFQFMIVVLAVMVEGGTWTFAVNAEYLASKGLPHQADTRKMWFLALAAAVMNGYHGAITMNRPEMGVILGAASLLGPYIWHRYIRIRENIIETKSGRNPEQIRAALRRRLHHPVLTWRAADVWSAAGGAMSRELAWRIVWLQAKGAAPGMTPKTELVPVRNGWLFQKLFGRVANPVREFTVTTYTLPIATPATPAAKVAQPAAEQVAEEVAQPMGNPVQTLPEGVAQPLGNQVADGWADDIESYLAAWSATPDATPTATPEATSEATSAATPATHENPSSTEVAQPDATHRNQEVRNPAQPTATKASATRSTEVAQETATRRAQPGATAADKVAEFFAQEVAKGVAPNKVSPSEAANYATEKGFKCSRQAAGKKLAKLIEKHRAGER